MRTSAISEVWVLVSVELANKILLPKSDGSVNLNPIGQIWGKMENKQMGCRFKGEPLA